MAKKEQVPAIRFQGFADPWEQRKLLDCIQKITDFRGRTPKKLGMDWSESGYLALSALNVKDGYIDFTQDVHYGDQALYDKWMIGNELHMGQVLFTTEAPMGNVAQVPDNRRYILSQRTIAFDVKPNLITENFLATVLKSPAVFAMLTALSSGGTAKGVSQKSLATVDIIIPSDLTEQEHLSATFSQLDTLITLHQRKYNKLVAIKRSMLEKMFPREGSRFPEIRFAGFTDPWEQRKLEEFMSFFSGLTYSPKDIRPSGTLVLRSSNVKDGEIIDADNVYVDSEIVNSENVRDGDIIVVVRNGSRALIGKHAEIKGFKPNTVIGAFMTGIRSEHPSFVNALLNTFSKMEFLIPSADEQDAIGEYFRKLDDLITLHQRERENTDLGRKKKLNQFTRTDLFCDYYAQWVSVYKEGAIRKVTLDKYLMTQEWLKKLIPEVRLCDMTRIVYQQLLNDYARIHERQTTMDFHHQLKGAILDAVDEGLIDHDPTRKVIIKGKQPTEKKIKYLNQYELHTLLKGLNLGKEISWDWFILLVAKTGMRFSEALALTPKDFDLSHQLLSVSKTWDYKGKGGFLPTKNKSSVRKIQIDWQIVVQFSELLKDLPEDKPIFVTKERVYNSTVNDILARHCRALEIPVISVHGLRHTHASVLLFAGVSIGSVARRLGHASMTTTQKTYLHIIHELENQDVDLVMRSLSSLC